MKRFVKKPFLYGLLCLLLGVNVFLGVWFYRVVSDPYPEVALLRGNTMNLKQLTDYFTDIAKTKGAVYAFNLLGRIHIPRGIDVHLVGHGIGDVLYDQKGPEGIIDCTQDFGSACAHQIVINTFYKEGPSAFSTILETCKKSPGGKNGYSLCYHGVGHGVLAYNGYDFAKAMEMCGLAGSKMSNEVDQCRGGATMEMVFGIHDVDIWKKQTQVYFSKEHPLSPCDTDIVPPEAKRMCYIYLTPRFLTLVGTSVGAKPTDAQLTKAMSYCDPLSGSLRIACYGGFGKEYAPMANGKDTRTMGVMPQQAIEKTFKWCTLAGKRPDVSSCVTEAVRSMYWAGENSPQSSLAFCSVAHKHGYGMSCFGSFLEIVKTFQGNNESRQAICSAVPREYTAFCESMIL